MSCDSVRRNFASIPDGKALPWVWRENLHLLQDVVAEDYVADLAMRGREIKRNDMSSPLALNDDHPKVPRIVTPEAG